MLTRYHKIKGFRPFGARLEVHGAVFLIIAVCILANLKSPISALLTAMSYFGIIFIHECGHAFFAKRYHYRVTNIQLSFMHGICVYEDDDLNEWNETVIAWGGVLAQLAVVLLVLLLGFIPVITSIPALRDAAGILGPINLVIALINLIPVPPLDGATAWRIFPLAWDRWRPRRKTKKRSPFKSVR